MIENLASIYQNLEKQWLKYIQGSVSVISTAIHTFQIHLIFVELLFPFFFRVMLIDSFMHSFCPFKFSIEFMGKAWKRSPSWDFYLFKPDIQWVLKWFPLSTYQWSVDIFLFWSSIIGIRTNLVFDVTAFLDLRKYKILSNPFL